jgi:hypothetical protein
VHANDRDEFKTILGQLCAAFGVPMTRAREEAFWIGLARMSLLAFRKCVEFAIGPDYDGTEFPRTGQIWKIYKGTAISPNAPDVKALPADQDHITYLANRLLFLHMTHRGGLGSTGTFIPGTAKISGMNDCHASDELAACLKFKRELVAQFCGFVNEGDELATPAAFARWWAGGLAKVSEVLPRTMRNYAELAAEPESQKPFPAFMARELTPAQPELA